MNITQQVIRNIRNISIGGLVLSASIAFAHQESEGFHGNSSPINTNPGPQDDCEANGDQSKKKYQRDCELLMAVRDLWWTVEPHQNSTQASFEETDQFNFEATLKEALTTDQRLEVTKVRHFKGHRKPGKIRGLKGFTSELRVSSSKVMAKMNFDGATPKVHSHDVTLEFYKAGSSYKFKYDVDEATLLDDDGNPINPHGIGDSIKLTTHRDSGGGTGKN